MDKEKAMKLKEMQTNFNTPSEIAEELEMTVDEVERELTERGYKPHRNSKLSAEQKAEICGKYMSGSVTQRALAKQYGVSVGTVSNVISKGFKGEAPDGTNGTTDTADTKKEPASVDAETSSEQVSLLEPSGSNYTPDLHFCQSNLENISKSILEMYGGFSGAEKRAFDLGTIFRQVLDTHNCVDEILMKGGDPNV